MIAYVDLWQFYDVEGKWTLTMNQLWIFMAHVPYPIGDRILREKWEIDEEKDTLSYYYSDSIPGMEEKFKVRKYRLL